MKRLLISTEQSEERRIALVENDRLYDYEVEIAGQEPRKGNIYKGTIVRIENSLEAAFVDYGEDKNGFLPFKDIRPEYFRSGDGSSGNRISKNDTVIVQVEKEERGDKGAALTTNISLPGCYLVLMPKCGGKNHVSRAADAETRSQWQQMVTELGVSDDMSVLLRTAGVGRSIEELRWDFGYLMNLWTAIEAAARVDKGGFLIYSENNMVIRAIRDHFKDDVNEVVCDTPETYEEARDFIQLIVPEYAERVRYSDGESVFNRNLERQIEEVHEREIVLPSGGRIVFDTTEALVAVDVNSSRATKGHDIEETALATNMEAAREVARHLRIRDLSGLVVIDFIDMERRTSREKVQQEFRRLVRSDRARVRTTDISSFGLMEMSRQRLSTALVERSSTVCPRCEGKGRIVAVRSNALAALRDIRQQAQVAKTAAVVLDAPVETATYLLNEKRIEIRRIEDESDLSILVLPNIELQTPHYKIRRIQSDSSKGRQFLSQLTPEMGAEKSESKLDEHQANKPVQLNTQSPVVNTMLPDTPAPTPAPAEPEQQAEPEPVRQPEPAKKTGGFFKKIMAAFSGSSDTAVTPEPEPAPEPATSRRRGGEFRARQDSNQNAATAEGGAAQPRRNRNQRSRGRGEGKTRENGRQEGSERPQRQHEKREGKTGANQPKQGQQQSQQGQSASENGNGATPDGEKGRRRRRQRGGRRSSSTGAEATGTEATGAEAPQEATIHSQEEDKGFQAKTPGQWNDFSKDIPSDPADREETAAPQATAENTDNQQRGNESSANPEKATHSEPPVSTPVAASAPAPAAAASVEQSAPDQVEPKAAEKEKRKPDIKPRSSEAKPAGRGKTEQPAPAAAAVSEQSAPDQAEPKQAEPRAAEKEKRKPDGEPRSSAAKPADRAKTEQPAPTPAASAMAEQPKLQQVESKTAGEEKRKTDVELVSLPAAKPRRDKAEQPTGGKMLAQVETSVVESEQQGQ